MTQAILNVDAHLLSEVAPLLADAGIQILYSLDSPPGTGLLRLMIEGDAIPAHCEGMDVNAEIRLTPDHNPVLSRIELR